MSVVFATQLTAVATLALAVLALATAILAFLAWRKQSREVSDQAEMLKLQAGELRQVSAERERGALERRRAQATLVYMTIEYNPEEMRHATRVHNTSGQPVYDIELCLDNRADQRLPVLLPGETHTWEGLGTAYSSGERPVWITFRDSAGIHWTRHPDGRRRSFALRLRFTRRRSAQSTWYCYSHARPAVTATGSLSASVASSSFRSLPSSASTAAAAASRGPLPAASRLVDETSAYAAPGGLFSAVIPSSSDGVIQRARRGVRPPWRPVFLARESRIGVRTPAYH